jgi:hypothetical protein
VLPVELQYVVDGVPEADQRGDDGAGTRAEDEIERLAEFPARKALNLLESTKRVEPLRPAAVEAKNPA